MKEKIESFILNQDFDKLSESDLNNDDYTLINYIWKSIRESDSSVLNEIKQIFVSNKKENQFDILIDFVKKINEEYYVFEYFRDEKNSETDKISLLVSIMEKAILRNRIVELKSQIKSITSDKLELLIKWISILVQFCINNNFTGDKIEEILFRQYGISKGISQSISKLYEENLISLKLTYIINLLNGEKNN